MKETKVNLASD